MNLILLAIQRTGYKVYEGTVPRSEIDRRRARNKRARAARKAARR